MSEIAVRSIKLPCGVSTPVLGQGTLGRPVTAALAAAGFQAVGWARSPRGDAPWPGYSDGHASLSDSVNTGERDAFA